MIRFNIEPTDKTLHVNCELSKYIYSEQFDVSVTRKFRIVNEFTIQKEIESLIDMANEFLETSPIVNCVIKSANFCDAMIGDFTNPIKHWSIIYFNLAPVLIYIDNGVDCEISLLFTYTK